MGILHINKKDTKNKPTRYFSKIQEDTVAKNLGGKTTKNSGATMFDKSDVTLNKWCIECKTKITKSKQITIHKEWMEKLKQESCFMGKDYYSLIFNFGPDEKNYVIMDEDTFKLLLNLNNDNN